MLKFLVFFFVFVFVKSEDELLIADPSPVADSRIVGGTTTTIETFPYTVQVIRSSLVCGGSILTRRHILSAAHCFVDDYGFLISPTQYTIRVGTTNNNSGGSTHRVSTIVIHERYNVPLRDNDIAVLVLSSQITYNNRARAGFIPTQGFELPDNVRVTHVGWGNTNPYVSSMSSTLQQVTINSVNRTVCAQRYGFLQNQTGVPYFVTTNMICAGLLDIGGADACQGDSGGPLIYGDVVVGITSWGASCALASYPGVNVRVSMYTSWINSVVARYSNGNFIKGSWMLLSASILISLVKMYSL